MLITPQSISLSLIDAGENDRQDFSHVPDLAADIYQRGLDQPISVRPHPATPGRYQIVMGESRQRAYLLLNAQYPGQGWDSIPAFVREMTDEQADAAMLAENVQRKNLDPLEEAKGYKKRMDKYGWTVEEAALHCHVSPGRVADRLKLLDIVPEAQHLAAVGQLELGKAQMLAGLDRNRQRIALRALNARPMTNEQFGTVVNNLRQQQSAETSQQSLWALPELETKPDYQIAAELLKTQTETRTMAVTLPDNHPLRNACAKIHVVIEVPAGSKIELDSVLIAQAIQIQEVH